MQSILILDANLVNEGTSTVQDVLIRNGRIEEIGRDLANRKADMIIEAEGKALMPGMIDDQVHFREPGLTHKADIHTESKAALVGGITSFMDMPNTRRRPNSNACRSRQRSPLRTPAVSRRWSRRTTRAQSPERSPLPRTIPSRFADSSRSTPCQRMRRPFSA